MSKHTPGPWFLYANDNTGYWEIHDKSGHVCECESQSHASLIAAAPELLETARRALPVLDASYLDMVEKWGEHDLGTLEVFDTKEQVKQAIANAEGRS